MTKIAAAALSSLPDREPYHRMIGEVDLDVVRVNQEMSLFYGPRLHRRALMSDGHGRREHLICGVHDWDCRLDDGVSSHASEEACAKFGSWIEGNQIMVDADDINQWGHDNPQPYKRDAYLGAYANPICRETDELYTGLTQQYARDGLSKTGHLRVVNAKGVFRAELHDWGNIQLLTAQSAKAPLLEEAMVGTDAIIDCNAQKPLRLNIPLFVSDMSFGAMSELAKTALTRGAEMAGAGICSGEGGMLLKKQEANSRYFYKLASARFGFSRDELGSVQILGFKGGQRAKIGTGVHLPDTQVQGEIADVPGLKEGQHAISPARLPDWTDPAQIRDFGDERSDRTGSISIGYKPSPQHIEKDIDSALKVGVDDIILDERGGGKGAIPVIFCDNIFVPTIPARARACAGLDRLERRDVSLVNTGGLRKPAAFIKVMALWGDAIAFSGATIRAIGRLTMRACHTSNCPVGVVRRKLHLVSRIVVEKSARQLANFFKAFVERMQVMARACGYSHLSNFKNENLTRWKNEMADISGVTCAGAA